MSPIELGDWAHHIKLFIHSHSARSLRTLAVPDTGSAVPAGPMSPVILSPRSVSSEEIPSASLRPRQCERVLSHHKRRSQARERTTIKLKQPTTNNQKNNPLRQGIRNPEPGQRHGPELESRYVPFPLDRTPGSSGTIDLGNH